MYMNGIHFWNVLEPPYGRMPFCDAPLLLPYCIDSLYANFATGTGACFFIACNLICNLYKMNVEHNLQLQRTTSTFRTLCTCACVHINLQFGNKQPITDKLMEKSTTAMLIYLTRKVECRL
ncbi:putative pyruvate formate-lyase activating enzyme [Trichinella spiralis]|uniref:putative pyruvate formate-lyase activating enzyme n=1 Tax=Trichinella spiralis TaxID=6334 RepID=UPI0001EFDF18|nr:putative pyruvate formate-lyase activating enzyme [Trichinella spiralis]